MQRLLSARRLGLLCVTSPLQALIASPVRQEDSSDRPDAPGEPGKVLATRSVRSTWPGVSAAGPGAVPVSFRMGTPRRKTRTRGLPVFSQAILLNHTTLRPPGLGPRMSPPVCCMMTKEGKNAFMGHLNSSGNRKIRASQSCWHLNDCRGGEVGKQREALAQDAAFNMPVTTLDHSRTRKPEGRQCSQPGFLWFRE